MFPPGNSGEVYRPEGFIDLQITNQGARILNKKIYGKTILLLVTAGTPFCAALALDMPKLPAPPNIPSRIETLKAPADGVSDAAPAINAAIESLAAKGGGTLEFREGTYLVRVNPAATDHVLQLESNIRLQGSTSGTSTILLARKQPSYTALLGMTKPIHDVDIENLTIDLDGENNPITSPADRGTHRALQNYRGPRFRVAFCTIQNAADGNTLDFNGTPVTDIEVANNTFRNIGQFPGSFDYDHSTIYTNAVRVWIHDNTFSSRSGPGTTGARAAIETHGDDTTVTHNTIDGYEIGMNITGRAVSSNRQLYNKNVMKNVMYGMEIYSRVAQDNSTQGMRNITVENNEITLNLAWRTTGLIPTHSPSPRYFPSVFAEGSCSSNWNGHSQ